MPQFLQEQVKNLVSDLLARPLRTVKIDTGTGLRGGGDLTADRLIQLDGLPASLATLTDIGFLAQGPGATAVARTILGTAGRITVQNGAGQLGNPVLDLAPVPNLTTGSFTKITFDAYGRVIGGTSPTTLAGYGITDAIGGSGGLINGILAFGNDLPLDYPTYNNLSTGTRLLFKESHLTATNVDWAMGLSTNRLWFSIPTPSGGQDFAFYAGQNLVMRLDGTGALTLTGALRAATKSFLIPHPVRTGWTLEHGSLEGPEHGAYLRGHHTGSTVVRLPAYWAALVETGTASLILSSRNRWHVWRHAVGPRHFVVCTDAPAATALDFDYLIVGTRTDVPALRIEQQEPRNDQRTPCAHA